MALGTFTLTGVLQDPDNQPIVNAKGLVILASQDLLKDTAGNIVHVGPVAVHTTSTGTMVGAKGEVVTLVTDTGVFYTLRWQSGRGTPPSVTFEAPAAASTLDLSDVVSAVPSPVSAIDAGTLDGRLDVVEAAVAERVRIVEAPITPYQYGAVGPGAAVDNTAPLQAMFAAAAAGVTAPSVYLPPGEWRSSFGAARTSYALTTGMTIRGASRNRSKLTIRSSGGGAPVFTWNSLIYGVRVEDLYLDTGVGAVHLFAAGATGGIAGGVFKNLFMVQQADDARLWYQDNGASFIQMTFEDCEMQRTIGSTVAPFYVRSTTNFANCNQFRQVRANGLNNVNTPFFEFRSGTDTGFMTDWTVMNIIGEQNQGGLFHVYGPSNWTFINATDEDAMSPYVADIFRFDKSDVGAGTPPQDVTMIGCRRLGSSLTAGDVYDIAFRDSRSTGHLINCNPNTMNQSSKILRMGQVSTHGVRGLPSSLSGAGTPESAVTAPIGSTYTRTDGTVGNVLYVKESSTGNTGWVAHTSTAGSSPEAIAAGESAMPRELATSIAVPMTSQTMRLSHFTALKDETINSVRVISGSTAAAATPTLVRVGLYTVAGNGDIALVASTANDTAIFATANTAYTKALSAPYVKVKGQRYALGVLVVTAAATPTLLGVTAATALANEMIIDPKLASAVNSQTDLPSSVVNASVLGSGNRVYGAIIP